MSDLSSRRADPETADLGRRLAEIALEAAAVIRPLWRTGLAVEAKADASPVTEADRRGEALIVERLQREFPGVAVVAEEQCADCGPPGTAPERFFLVDALDGTKAFVAGRESFTVNIGLIDGGAPAAGAVALPAADGRVWFTTRDGAARRDGGEARAIRVRPRPAEAEALLSHTVRPEETKRLAEQFGFARWRSVDSSLKFCLVAEGGADLYPRRGPTSEWDTAAGQAVLEAAGGSVESLEGGRLLYGKAERAFLNPGFVARGG